MPLILRSARTLPAMRLPRALVETWSHEPDWLEALPRLVADCAEEWSLELEPAVDTPHSLVVPAGDVVLKLNAPSHVEADHEADALERWDGRAAVRLVARDDNRRAFLLERCRPGTCLWDTDVDEETVVADLTVPGQRFVLAQGGNGGWGNLRFKTSTNQAPRSANPGQEGVERTIWLRLKLIADAGLVGLPNAGKSTFLAATSNARPKIADYPFTTLHPNLGVVRVGERDFVLADIPGLIEGAHEGVGIGDRFLGHVERCKVLVHLVDGTQDDVKTAYTTIRSELRLYDEALGVTVLT